MEVVSGVHRVEGGLGDRFVCMYVIEGDERAMVIDTGVAGSVEGELLPYLRKAGIDPARIEYVLTSHADVDHTGGNAALAALVAPHARFLAHALDRAMIADVETLVRDRYEAFRTGWGIDFGDGFSQFVRDNAGHVAVDIAVQGGERIRLGADVEVELLHTPGHSRGHLTAWLPRQRTAIVQDAVLGRHVPTAEGRPAVPPTYRHLDDYLATIDALAQLPIDVLLTGHYPVYRGSEVDRFLADSRAFADDLDTVLRQLLRDSGAPATAAELIERIDPQPHGWPADAHVNLIFPLAGHLERLEAAGLAVADRSQPTTRWAWA